MLDARRVAVIREAVREPPQHTRAPGHLAQHRQAAIRRDPPGVKRTLHAAPSLGLKFERPRVTPCRVPAVPLVRIPVHLGSRSAEIWAGVPDHLGGSERSDGLGSGGVAVGVTVR